MPLSTTAITHSYEPAALQAAEAIPFQYLSSDDLIVVHIAAVTGVETVLAAGSDYVLAGDSRAGTATITASDDYPVDDLFVLTRVTEIKQDAAIVAHQALPSGDVVRQLDRMAMVEQEQDAQIVDTTARALLLPFGEVAGPLPSIEELKGQLLGFDGTTGAPTAALNSDAIFAARDAALASVNFRATFAEAIVDFAVGEYFTSNDTGLMRMYRRVVGSPFYLDMGDSAAPLMQSLLAAPGGDAFVGSDDDAGGSKWTTLEGFKAYLRSPVGSVILGHRLDTPDAVDESVYGILRHTVTLQTFGARGNGDVADIPFNNAAWVKAVAYLTTTRARLLLLPGDYKYTVAPNLAINDLEVIAQGRVRLYYEGVGEGIIFDAGALAGDLCYNVRFCVGNRVHFYGKSTTQNAVWVRSVHHSHIGVNVHGCGAAYAGLISQFAVCTVLDVVVSGNEGGWFEGNKPAVGYSLQARLAGETTSYCYVANPVIEGTIIGINFIATLGNVVVAGTAEGCSDYGMVFGVGAMWDRVIGTDFEVNTIADVYCNGLGIEFINCDTYDAITLGSGARRCIINGGGHEDILVDTGSLACSVLNTVYNRRATGGTFVEDGVGTEISNVRSGVAPYAQYLTGSLAVSLAAVGYPGTGVETVTVTGAKLGDFFLASCSAAIGSFQMTCHCNAAGSVSVYFNNIAGASADRAACTIKVRGWRGT